ncbi:MAG: hypothetical protein NC181_03040 [Clostridium sp.]|nr:hypothetical protein [Clostridium sp.]MCM1444212.1 hypothetical protein [Candidatus Amulumruptor caecigallinarius]
MIPYAEKKGIYTDIWDTLQDNLKIINYYEKQINNENYQIILSEIYNFIKKVSKDYYDESHMCEAYKHLLISIIKLERKLPYKKMLDIKINETLENNDNIILKIINKTREYLVLNHSIYEGLNKKIEDINLTNDCKKSSEYISFLCKQENIECHTLIIDPGYSCAHQLYNGCGYHYINIVKYNNKYYLLDATYSQFFYLKSNNLDRIGIVKYANCNVGAFMIMNHDTKKIATTILEDGYIELNEQVFKKYLDGFTISYRNGLYYESTGDYSYTAPYSVDDYIKFFRGEDNQVNHEGRENLGYQMRPLKNWKLNLKK